DNLEEEGIVEDEILESPPDDLDADGEAVRQRRLNGLIVEDIEDGPAVAGDEMLDLCFPRDPEFVPSAVGLVPCLRPFQLAVGPVWVRFPLPPLGGSRDFEVAEADDPNVADVGCIIAELRPFGQQAFREDTLQA